MANNLTFGAMSFPPPQPQAGIPQSGNQAPTQYPTQAGPAVPPAPQQQPDPFTLLQQRILDLESRLQNPLAPESRRKPLPVGAPFDGSQDSFPAWKITMQHKLRTDKIFIGGPQELWVFLWGNLAPKVQSRVAAFYEEGGARYAYDTDRFLDYLTTCYGDPHRKSGALAKLELFRMRDQDSFARFHVQFEQLLAQAGGLTWSDEVKVNYFRSRLSPRLRDKAIGIITDPTQYEQTVDAYRRIAYEVEAWDMEQRHRKRGQGHQGGGTKQTSSPSGPQGGDVVMTDVAVMSPSHPRQSTATGPQRGGARASGARQRARWASMEEMNRRRESGVCLRCGHQGHFARSCSLLPAQRPAQVQVLRSVDPDPDDVDDLEGKE